MEIADHDVHAIYAMRSEAVRKAFERKAQPDQLDKILGIGSHTAQALSNILGTDLYTDTDAPLWTAIGPGKVFGVEDFQPHIRQILGLNPWSPKSKPFL